MKNGWICSFTSLDLLPYMVPDDLSTHRASVLLYCNVMVSGEKLLIVVPILLLIKVVTAAGIVVVVVVVVII